MQFEIPEKSLVESARGRILERPLQAEGTMNYREFIALVKALWEEVYPDIPILPVQGKTYTNYPVIVYSLETRKPHNAEPKKRYREELNNDDSTSNTIVSGQRFQNYVAFSAITDNEPELCETIIETFEEFMDEHTKFFKRNGLSDIFYGRRLSDREETRTGEDVCIRTVVYMCIIERITKVDVEKIERVKINVAAAVKPLAKFAWVPATEYNDVDCIDTDQFVNLSNTELKVGDLIRVIRPTADDLIDIGGNPDVEALGYIPGSTIQVENENVPGGIKPGEIYTVTSVNGELFQLALEGTETPVDITDEGWFKFVFFRRPVGEFELDIEEYDEAATPDS